MKNRNNRLFVSPLEKFTTGKCMDRQAGAIYFQGHLVKTKGGSKMLFTNSNLRIH